MDSKCTRDNYDDNDNVDYESIEWLAEIIEQCNVEMKKKSKILISRLWADLFRWPYWKLSWGILIAPFMIPLHTYNLRLTFSSFYCCFLPAMIDIILLCCLSFKPLHGLLQASHWRVSPWFLDVTFLCSLDIFQSWVFSLSASLFWTI